MKQLACEMCGSTDLIKQDGVFVCQSCGMKYSVEDAKKMMVEGTVEVQGNVQVQNAAQLENLIKLARSSFDSNNYSQAEAFCNQVIAMDDKNYDAWKLKGEAINYQVNSENQRMLEAYNCIMTSYRVLNDEQKATKKQEILSSLKKCFEEEVIFWLSEFEAKRPSEATYTRATAAYVDAYNKLAATFDELGLSEEKEKYLLSFENFFIKQANLTCVSAWKSTVGYNYYRDDFDTLGRNWGRGSSWNSMVTTDTYSYRPMEETGLTFLNETTDLIALLTYVEELFNDETDCETVCNVYDNIVYFRERLIDLIYYKIDSVGYEVGWCVAGYMTDQAKREHQKEIALCKSKKEKATKKIQSRELATKEKAEKDKIQLYWEQHAEEAQQLKDEESELEKRKKALTSEKCQVEKFINEIEAEKKVSSPLEEEIRIIAEEQMKLIKNRASLGLFAIKDKKRLSEEIKELAQKETDLRGQIEKENAEKAKRLDQKAAPLRNQLEEINKEIAVINNRKKAIEKEWQSTPFGGQKIPFTVTIRSTGHEERKEEGSTIKEALDYLRTFHNNTPPFFALDYISPNNINLALAFFFEKYNGDNYYLIQLAPIDSQEEYFDVHHMDFIDWSLMEKVLTDFLNGDTKLAYLEWERE